MYKREELIFLVKMNNLFFVTCYVCNGGGIYGRKNLGQVFHVSCYVCDSCKSKLSTNGDIGPKNTVNDNGIMIEDNGKMVSHHASVGYYSDEIVSNDDYDDNDVIEENPHYNVNEGIVESYHHNMYDDVEESYNYDANETLESNYGYNDNDYFESSYSYSDNDSFDVEVIIRLFSKSFVSTHKTLKQ